MRLSVWREHTEKFSASVMGQVIGSRAERYRLKSVAQKKLTLTGPDKVDGRCGDKVVMKWNLDAASSPSLAPT